MISIDFSYQAMVIRNSLWFLYVVNIYRMLYKISAQLGFQVQGKVFENLDFIRNVT